jgi:hypothetical protein
LTFAIFLSGPLATSVHFGGTDSDGGYPDHSAGAYYWHHGHGVLGRCELPSVAGKLSEYLCGDHQLYAPMGDGEKLPFVGALFRIVF